MFLLIDIGNTSAKIAISNGDEFIHFERKAADWKTAIGNITERFQITACAISTVAGRDEELEAVIAVQPYPTTWLTWQTPCPVKQAICPQGMGADRWAADIAAMDAAPDRTLLVIDAGTCLTYDVWSADGRCLGGGISPGVQLRLKAMHEHTALLPSLTATSNTPLLGYDTETAMMTGAVNGTKLEIEGFIRYLWAEHPDLCVFITGGNKFDFSDDIHCPITYDPYLVLRGLLRCLNKKQ